MVHRNYFRTPLIASLCGLSFHGEEKGWQGFVDDLNEEDAQRLCGRLLQEFNVLTGIAATQGQSDFRLKANQYLTYLEKEFEDWLAKEDEVIDYYLCLRFGLQDQQTEGGYWTQYHKDLWKYREREIADFLPSGIRLLMLVEKSVKHLLQNRLEPALLSFFTENSPITSGIGDITTIVERGCGFFRKKPSDILGGTYPIFDNFRKQNKTTEIDPSCRKAAGLLDDIKRSLPEEILEKHITYLNSLKESIAIYKTPKPKFVPLINVTPYASPFTQYVGCNGCGARYGCYCR